jgi:hypothetical protein
MLAVVLPADLLVWAAIIAVPVLILVLVVMGRRGRD